MRKADKIVDCLRQTRICKMIIIDHITPSRTQSTISKDLPKRRIITRCQHRNRDTRARRGFCLMYSRQCYISKSLLLSARRSRNIAGQHVHNCKRTPLPLNLRRHGYAVRECHLLSQVPHSKGENSSDVEESVTIAMDTIVKVPIDQNEPNNNIAVTPSKDPQRNEEDVPLFVSPQQHNENQMHLENKATCETICSVEDREENG